MSPFQSLQWIFITLRCKCNGLPSDYNVLNDLFHPDLGNLFSYFSRAYLLRVSHFVFLAILWMHLVCFCLKAFPPPVMIFSFLDIHRQSYHSDIKCYLLKQDLFLDLWIQSSHQSSQSLIYHLILLSCVLLIITW